MFICLLQKLQFDQSRPIMLGKYWSLKLNSIYFEKSVEGRWTQVQKNELSEQVMRFLSIKTIKFWSIFPLSTFIMIINHSIQNVSSYTFSNYTCSSIIAFTLLHIKQQSISYFVNSFFSFPSVVLPYQLDFSLLWPLLLY